MNDDKWQALKEKKAAMVGGEEGYQKADRLVQRGTRNDKAKWLEEKCREVEDELRHHSMRKTYDLIKTLRKGSQLR